MPSLGEILDSQPDWLTAHLRPERAAPQLTPEQLASIRDRDAQAAIAALVRERQAEQARIAERERSVKEQARSLVKERQLNAQVAEQATAFVRDPALQKYLAELAASPQPADKDSDEYVAWLATQQAGAVVRDFMARIAAVDARQAQARAQAEAAAQAEAKVQADARYIGQHMDDFRDPEIMERVKVLVSRGFSVEEGHTTALAERMSRETKDLNELKVRSRDAARNHARGNRPPPAMEPPANLTAAERDRWYQEHPEARAARLAAHRQRGVGYR